MADDDPLTATVWQESTMADNFKTGSDAETFKVESDVESSSGDSDYCPSNDGSYIESSPRPKPPRRGRKRTAKEAESRTLMRQWLLDLIGEGGIEGLYWIDDDSTLVHIPWLHASRHTFDTAKDSTLFKLWAVHSGKYVPDEDTPDPKRWKANFRCAINSLSDVHEEKGQNCKKGHDAYKVYRFDADKRLAKKRSCPSRGQRAVVNADSREKTRAKKQKTASGANESAVAKWLNQVQPDSDTYNDITGDEFGDLHAKNELSPVDAYDAAGICHPEMLVVREETVVSTRDDYGSDDVNLAAIPLTVEEFSSRTPMPRPDVYETLCSYGSDACESPLGSDTSSTDSGLSDSLTDKSITEMVDEWQSETGSCAKWFLQLTSVNISSTPDNDYSCLDTPLSQPF